MTPPVKITPGMNSILARAQQLMNTHGLHDWTLKITRGTRTAGWCHHQTRTIGLSHKILPHWPESEIVDTILHEIAHALAPAHEIHGPEWRAIARRIGANPKRTYDGQLPVPARVNMIATCNCEGKEWVTARREDSRCWTCDARHLWRKDGAPLAAARPYNSRNSANRTIELGEAMGATRDDVGLRAPRGKLWAMSESRFVDAYDDDPETLRRFRSDVEGGFMTCSPGCYSCDK